MTGFGRHCLFPLWASLQFENKYLSTLHVEFTDILIERVRPCLRKSLLLIKKSVGMHHSPRCLQKNFKQFRLLSALGAATACVVQTGPTPFLLFHPAPLFTTRVANMVWQSHSRSRHMLNCARLSSSIGRETTWLDGDVDLGARQRPYPVHKNTPKRWSGDPQKSTSAANGRGC